MMRSMWRRAEKVDARVAVALFAAAMLVGCTDTSREPTASGSLSGEVIVSGPLRGAKISVDQIETKDPAMSIRNHVADATTDGEGRFTIETGPYSGFLLVTATGGSFVDSPTGATVQLDTTDGLTSIIPFELLDVRDDT